MFSRYNFGFDMDGVLYDWLEALKPTIKTLGHYFENKEDLFNYVFSRNKTFQDNIISLPFAYSTLYPRKSIVEVVIELSKKYEIFYITYRPKSAYLGTLRWLKENKFPNPENLIFSSNKALDVRAYKIDFFVEDREENIEKLIGITNVIQKINFYTKNIIDGVYKTIYNIEELKNFNEED